MITKNIFLYHLDYEIQKLFNVDKTYFKEAIYSYFNLVTRIAYLLCTENVIIPASNYFESDIAFKIINTLEPLNEFGIIKLASSSYTLEELLQKKEIQHTEGTQYSHYHYQDFKSKEKKLYLPGTLIKRERSASKDIKNAWFRSVGSELLWEKLYNLMPDKIKASDFETILYRVPEKLGDKAYISEYILPYINVEQAKIKAADTLINIFVTKKYIESFLDEFDALCFKNIPLIDTNLILPDNPENNRYLPYNLYVEKLQVTHYKGVSAKDYIARCSALELITFKNTSVWHNIASLDEGLDDISKKIYIIPNYRITNKDIMDLKKDNQINRTEEFDMNKILIVTALKIELEEILQCFAFPIKVESETVGSRKYHVITPNSNTTIVCTAILGMGQVNAALAIKDALTFMRFDRIILAGICGGLSDKLKIGDLVISEKIVDYELAKVYDNDKVIRWNVYNSDYAMLSELKNFESNRWKEQIKEHFPNKQLPNILTGTVLSGNKVMASRTEADRLVCIWDKALAIEMEASGIANALYQTVGAPPFIMVKSVCDLADANKNDDWQIIAAKTSAVYVLDYIFSINKQIKQVEQQDKDNDSKDINLAFVLTDTYNLSELNVLCFNLEIDFEDINGHGKKEKIVELIKYCKRRRMLDRLIAQVNIERDNIIQQ